MAKKNTYNYIHELTEQLAELKSRATQVDYKNQIPKIPEAVIAHPVINDHLLIGFHKRLHNWTNGLLQIEYPDGLPQLAKPDIEVTAIGEALLISEIDIDIKQKTIDVDIQQRTIYITGDGMVTDTPPTDQD